MSDSELRAYQAHPLARRIIAIALKGIILLGTAVIVISLALIYWPPMQFVGVKLLGRSKCDWPETMRAGDYAVRYRNAVTQIESGHRLIQSDGAHRLWDVPGARQFWIRGEFSSLNSVAFAEQVADNYWHPSVHIRPGDIVLDCGADYGGVTWRALSAGASKVVAIEIDPGKITSLNRTFAKEIAEGRVIVVPLGLWDKEGTLELGGDSVVFERGGGKQQARVTTLDQVVADLRLPRVDFISMDIEGSEKPALRGAKRTLQAHHPRLAIAAEHLHDDLVAIPKLVRDLAGPYDLICGQCQRVEYDVVPTVLFFHPR